MSTQNRNVPLLTKIEMGTLLSWRNTGGRKKRIPRTGEGSDAVKRQLDRRAWNVDSALPGECAAEEEGK
jgi:hypothetical protein